MRTFKIYTLSNFQKCNTILLTVVTMLYITYPWLITGNLYVLIAFIHFSYPPAPTSGNHQSFLCIYEFCLLLLLYICLIPHLSEIIWYLSFPVWLISLSIMPSRTIHIVACCVGCKVVVQFHFLHVVVQFSQHHLLKGLSFPDYIFLALLS